jgi:hypothetical protein
MDRPPSFADIDAALAALGPKARRTRPDKGSLRLISRARKVDALVSQHRKSLAALPGFDLAALDQLPELIERAQQAEIAWQDQRVQRRQRRLRKLRDEAIALRFRLVSAARYAFRKNPEALRPFDGFYRQRGIATVVGDLHRLADLAEEHPWAFADVPGLPEKPADAARELQEKLVQGRAGPPYGSAKANRNASMLLLKLALDEVISGAVYLFRYQPKMLDRLVDEADRRSKRRSRKKRSRKSPASPPSVVD